jgi:hypothetical protein
MRHLRQRRAQVRESRSADCPSILWRRPDRRRTMAAVLTSPRGRTPANQWRNISPRTTKGWQRFTKPWSRGRSRLRRRGPQAGIDREFMTMRPGSMVLEPRPMPAHSKSAATTMRLFSIRSPGTVRIASRLISIICMETQRSPTRNSSNNLPPTLSRERTRLSTRRPTPGACMTCSAMSLSGAKIPCSANTRARPPTVQPG